MLVFFSDRISIPGLEFSNKFLLTNTQKVNGYAHLEKPNSSNVSPEARLQADKVAPTKVLLCGEKVKSYSATQTLCYIILNCLDVGVVEGNDSGKQSAPKIFGAPWCVSSRTSCWSTFTHQH